MPSVEFFYANAVTQATIPNGSSTSNEIDLRYQALMGLHMPAAFTGTTITFTASNTAGGTFNPVYKDDGTQYSVTVATNRAIAIDYTKLAGFRFIKLVSGSTEGATRTIPLGLKPL